MPFTKRLLFLTVLSFVFSNVLSQLPILEQDPAYINWQIIKTDHFKIIFPTGLNDQANKTANTLEAVYGPLSSSIGVSPRRITVVLRTQNAISNGFVSQQPRRSEFYLTPPQNAQLLGTNNWSDLLAIHEYRHVAQLYKANRGLNRLLYLLFGQQVIGAIVNIAVPDWFLEGDATLMETVYSKSGRGRIPNFSMQFKANLLEHGKFTYNKQYLGSFNHAVPDHYRLGYYMVNHIRKENDRQVWDRILKRAYFLPIIPFSFSSAIRRETSRFVVPTYNNMMVDLENDWRHEQSKLSITEGHRLSPRNSTLFTSYRYPQITSSGAIVALKSGLSDFSQFVEIDTLGNEKLVFVPGFLNDPGMLSVSGRKLIWTEFVIDPRWQTRSYSVIKTYDLDTKELRRISEKTKYMAASLSVDGKQIVTAQSTPELKNSIVILNADTGAEVLRLANIENRFLSMPRFSEDGNQVVCVSQVEDGRKTISIIDIATGQSKDILNLSFENVSHPVLMEEYLIFNSPYSGIDNIHVLNIGTGERFMMSSRKFGAYNATISRDKSKIYFQDYTKDGYDIVSTAFEPKKWTPLENVTEKVSCNCEEVMEQEGDLAVFEEIGNQEYVSKRYRKARGMINPYNWGGGITSSLDQVSASIESRDVLSTSFIAAGYSYDLEEKAGFGFTRFSYQGWYPIVDIELSKGGRSQNDLIPTNGQVEPTTINYSWNEQTAKVGLRLPLQFTRSKYARNFEVGTFTGLTDVSGFNQQLRPSNLLSNGVLRYMEHSMSYSRQHKRSKRDIASLFAQSFEVAYSHTPLGGDFEAAYFSAQGEFFFPGIVKHHSVGVRLGYQHQKIDTDANNYIFRNNIALPRGYGARVFKDYYNASINYALPLLHPDFSIGPLLHFQRVKGNVFYDYGINGTTNNFIQSYGIELRSDFNLMRFRTLLDLGLRYAYVPEINNGVFQVIIGNLNF